ncbi:MAG TPA: hypothetical protein VE420_04515, partial [Gemmatimonadales bacterium]|nr:hypothetical protein [Gemmatimonadales bacterium]
MTVLQAREGGGTRGMKVSIREGMVRGESLAEKLAWLESVGLDAVELHAGTLLLPAAEIEEAFTASPIS